MLDGIQVTFTGTAGARFDNATESFVFNAASFAATKTKLTALGESVEWNSVFTTEALDRTPGRP